MLRKISIYVIPQDFNLIYLSLLLINLSLETDVMKIVVGSKQVHSVFNPVISIKLLADKILVVNILFKHGVTLTQVMRNLQIVISRLEDLFEITVD